jgi:hypothetical protein
MKKKILALAIVFVLLLVGFLAVNAKRPGIDFNGPHYNLNLIGKKKDMPGDYLDTHRHVMFIPIDTTDDSFPLQLHEENGNIVYNPDGTISEDVPSFPGIKINITQGDEFLVLDGDATDGYGDLQLGPDKYEVYIAVRAKNPKVEDASTDITGWVEAYDNMGSLWYYISVGSFTVRKNKNQWTDATDLLFVDMDEDVLDYIEWQNDYVDTNDQYPIFEDLGLWVFDYMDGLNYWKEDAENLGLDPLYDFQDLAYFWQVVNSGNKLIQVRFYPM